MTFYDRIAKQWHQATGRKGGAFKELVLNDVLLRKLRTIEGLSILEVGAGNGYFSRLLLRHFSGQAPSRLVVTDQSGRLLDTAKDHSRIPEAEYRVLDVRQRFPFDDNSFHVILASMVFNELGSSDFRRALKECGRVLSNDGLCLIAVTHPDFIDSLQKRGLLKLTREGTMTMPGSGSLRLPAVVRSSEAYRNSLTESGFQFEEEDVFPTREVLNVKSGLRRAGKVPLALVFKCTKSIGSASPADRSEVAAVQDELPTGNQGR